MPHPQATLVFCTCNDCCGSTAVLSFPFILEVDSMGKAFQCTVTFVH